MQHSPMSLTHSDGVRHGDYRSTRLDNDHIGPGSGGGRQRSGVVTGPTAVGRGAAQSGGVVCTGHTGACGTLTA